MREIRIDAPGLERVEELLQGVPNGMQTALMRSFNRALMSGRTAAVRETTAQYTVKSKTTRETFKMSKARKANLEAGLTSEGRRLPLSLYAHRPTTDTTGANRRMVRVGVKKGAMKSIGQGFMWQGRVMQRLGDTRMPIEQKFGPAIPSIVDNDKTVSKVTDVMTETIDKRLDHETKWILEKSL